MTTSRLAAHVIVVKQTADDQPQAWLPSAASRTVNWLATPALRHSASAALLLKQREMCRRL
jgi:hypothetical protein